MVASSRTHPTPHGPSPPGGSTPPELPASSHSEAPVSDPLTTALLHFGLGSREAQLYRTLLKFGAMSARQSISLSGLDRATGYRVLSKLRARGLVTSTASRPQKFLPLEITKLFERSVAILRDDLEFLRVLREHYLADTLRTPTESRAPVSPVPPRAVPRARWPLVRIYPRAEDVGRGICQLADATKEEFDLLMMPQVLPESLRSEALRAIARTVDRGVRTRIVLDYHPVDLEFLSGVLKMWTSLPHNLEFRFYAPQLARLYLSDHRVALRCIRSAGSASVGPELGLSSDDPEWVRYQSTRFQAIWREALPMARGEAPLTPRRGSPPPSNARELRRWVERGAVVTGRIAGAELARMFGFDLPLRHRL